MGLNAKHYLIIGASVKHFRKIVTKEVARKKFDVNTGELLEEYTEKIVDHVTIGNIKYDDLVVYNDDEMNGEFYLNGEGSTPAHLGEILVTFGGEHNYTDILSLLKNGDPLMILHKMDVVAAHIAKVLKLDFQEVRPHVKFCIVTYWL